MSGWLEAARAAARLEPSRPRRPLHLALAGGHRLVGSIEGGTAARLAAAGLPIEPARDGWCIAGPADGSLAAIARWLHANGLGPHWRDELLGVVDASDRQVAVIERGVVRALGLTTFAVHLIGVTAGGSVWVQQRAHDKATDPGRWDTLMGGQVGAGESAALALARETGEEAGLDVASLADLRALPRLSFRRPVAEGYLVEHIDVFLATLADGTEPVNRDGEVERFECLAEDRLVARLAGGDFTLEATLILGEWLAARPAPPRPGAAALP